MSKRISTDEDETILTDLIDQLEDNLSPFTRFDVNTSINNNKAWIASEKYERTTTFLDGYLKNLDEFENQLRLPRTTVPQAYKLHIIATNVQTGSRDYSGEVEIELKVDDETDYIMIHSKNQNIHELHVYNRIGMTEVPLLDFHLYSPADTLTIYFLDKLTPGSELVIKIEYSAVMMTYEAGFYQTSYIVEGQTKYLGATQFQATEGRYTFPHYDEPGFKAVFDLAITHDPSLNAISNTLGRSQLK